MTTHDARRETAAGLDETISSADAVVARFRAAQAAGGHPAIERFLPPPGDPARDEALRRMIGLEFDCASHDACVARVEDYLARFPELGTADRAPYDLVAAECRARRRFGEAIDLENYLTRFPHLAEQLADGPFSNDEPSTVSDASIELAPGAIVGDYQVVRLLGRGSYSRVYLAHERSLDRLVALKVSRDWADEGRTLAQLDDPHVVPVYRQQTVGDLRLLAMRYVPGLTLADILKDRHDINLARWRGADLLRMLSAGDAESGDGADGHHERSGAADRQRFARLTFVEFVARIGRQLAGALAHAHAQHVLHRDIKPANVLVDREGDALLMDFNVASWHSGDDAPQRLGGTVAYMAPEHLASFSGEAAADDSLPDERSDIYSLGVVLFELLAGRDPWMGLLPKSITPALMRQTRAVRLHDTPRLPGNLAGVTPGLCAIVEKCLAPDAADRYQSAAALAEDLSRWLDHRPLATAAERSSRERARKFMRRHPRTMTAAATVLALAVGGVAWGAVSAARHLHAADVLLASAAKLADSQPKQASAALISALAELQQAHSLVANPLIAERREAAQRRLAELARQVSDDELRRFQTAMTDARMAPEPSPPGALVRAAAAAPKGDDPLSVYRVMDRPDWQTLPAYRALSPDQRRRVQEDVVEMLLTRAVALGDQGQMAPAHQLVEHLPEQVRKLPLVAAVYDHVANGQRPPSTAELVASANSSFAHFLVGLVAIKREEFDTALVQFERSEALRPPGEPERVWGVFFAGYCNERLGRTTEAAAAYRRCIELRPDFAPAHKQLANLLATFDPNQQPAADDR